MFYTSTTGVYTTCVYYMCKTICICIIKVFTYLEIFIPVRPHDIDEKLTLQSVSP